MQSFHCFIAPPYLPFYSSSKFNSPKKPSNQATFVFGKKKVDKNYLTRF